MCHLLHTEFPGIFGPTISQLFADKIDEIYKRFHPPKSRFRSGGPLDGSRHRRPTVPEQAIEDTRLVPVVLDLVAAQDIDKAEPRGYGRGPGVKIVRLLRQAHEQGAVLGLADVSLMIHIHFSTLYSPRAGPRARDGATMRRGTIHDMGRSVTHKAIICYKRLVESKPTSQVAKETFHSPEDVERYVQCLRRIQLCRDSGLSPEEMARATGHSLSLVQEYLDLIREFRLPRLPSSHGKGDSHL